MKNIMMKLTLCVLALGVTHAALSFKYKGPGPQAMPPKKHEDVSKNVRKAIKNIKKCIKSEMKSLTSDEQRMVKLLFRVHMHEAKLAAREEVAQETTEQVLALVDAMKEQLSQLTPLFNEIKPHLQEIIATLAGKAGDEISALINYLTPIALELGPVLMPTQPEPVVPAPGAGDGKNK